MTKTSVPITKAQADLPRLVRSGQMIVVLKHGVPVSVLVPHERMEMILETMEILANPEAMKAIRDYQRGKLKSIPLKKLGKELDAGKAAR